MKLNGKNLIVSVLIIGLMTIGVVGMATGYRKGSEEGEGILNDTMHQLLAEKLDMKAEGVESIMEETYNSVLETEDRPYQEAYLESLAGKLNMDSAELEKLMTETRLEAIEKLENEGSISEDLAASFKERASEFPFGYGGPQEGKDARGSRQGSTGNRVAGANETRKGYGDGSGNAPADGNGPGTGSCDGSGPAEKGSGKGRGRN